MASTSKTKKKGGKNGALCYWYSSKLVLLTHRKPLHRCQETQIWARSREGNTHTHAHKEKSFPRTCTKTKVKLRTFPEPVHTQVQIATPKNNINVAWERMQATLRKKYTKYELWRPRGGGQKVMQHRQKEHENKVRWEARDCDGKPDTWRRAGKRRKHKRQWLTDRQAEEAGLHTVRSGFWSTATSW